MTFSPAFVVALKKFSHSDLAVGAGLFLSALVAMVVANSSLYPLYDEVLNGTYLSLQLGSFLIAESVRFWINDGLMAIFFLLMGISIKRDMTVGELSSRHRATLPFIMALGGMVVPALIYSLFNYSDPERIHGWAIPSATDIAFSIGIMALLSGRVSAGLKVLLVAIAVIDDLGAIIIIALFYTNTLSTSALMTCGAIILALWGLNYRNVQRPAPYIILGILLWVAMFKSGIHATLSGVVLALFLPMGRHRPAHSLARRTEKKFQHLVTFLVLPLFGFANAGLNLTHLSFANMADPVPLGILLGLFIGKPAGILSAGWVAIRLKLASLPKRTTWPQVFAMAKLCGIGFTMSLFIGGLSFDTSLLEEEVKIGVLSGSLLSGLSGYLVMRLVTGADFMKKKKRR